MDALCNNVQYDFFFKCYADHRYLHVRTHSCPTRRSSDLCALGGEDDIIAKFLKKILYVGAFALILNNFQSLSEIIFRSFAGLGLTAGGSAIGASDLLLPGRSEEHTSELQSLMRSSYVVFCLKKTTDSIITTKQHG